MPPKKQTGAPESLQAYLQFVSDMLGGDLFPLEPGSKDVRTLISHRAIDYELICRIVREVRKYNSALSLYDNLEVYATLDALGKVRAHLLKRRGDVHQISLIDRIGELTVTFFNISLESASGNTSSRGGRVYNFNRSK